MFPPQKPPGKGPKPPGQGQPPTDPMMGPDTMGGMGMGPPPGPPPMMMPPGPMTGNGPQAGAGVDPMMAMLGGAGPFGGGPPPMPGMGDPMGGGLPVGGSIPMPGAMDGASQSPMLAALLGSQGAAPGMGGMGGDPYGTAPGEPDQTFAGVGTGDPQMGLGELLALLALAKAGVGGGQEQMGVPPGGSGVDGYPPNPGVGLGLGM